MPKNASLFSEGVLEVLKGTSLEFFSWKTFSSFDIWFYMEKRHRSMLTFV